MDIINNALDKFEKEFYYEESKNEKTSLRSIFDKLKNYKKTPLPKYDKDELAYYDSLEDKINFINKSCYRIIYLRQIFKFFLIVNFHISS